MSRALLGIGPPGEWTKEAYTITESSGSYVNILCNGKAWMGSVERTIALEICKKFNAYELSQQCSRLCI